MNKIDAPKVKLSFKNKEFYINNDDIHIIDLDCDIPKYILRITVPTNDSIDKKHKEIEIEMENKYFYKLIDELIKKGARLDLIYENIKLTMQIYNIFTYDKLDSKKIKTHICGYVISEN